MFVSFKLRTCIGSSLVFLSLIQLCPATRVCPQCVSLSDLVTPALGIRMSSDGLSSAIAFHNRTMVHASAIDGSSEYHDLMQHFQKDSQGGRLERPWDTCPGGVRAIRQSEYDGNFLSFLSALMMWPLNMWRQLSASNERYISLDQDTLVLLENFQNLIRTTEEAYKVLSPKIGVAVPEWLTDAQACKVITAISSTGYSIQILEHAPAAAFTAFGYDLCRVDSEWLPCSAPGRIMALEYDKSALTASLLNTPLLYWMQGKLIYSIKEDLAIDHTSEAAGAASTEQEMVEWINGFASTHRPDRVILLGPRTECPIFKKTVEASSISTLVITNPAIIAEHAVVMGIAKVTKDFLESQGEDCIEDEVCLEIRRKADALAKPHASIDEASDTQHTEL